MPPFPFHSLMTSFSFSRFKLNFASLVIKQLPNFIKVTTKIQTWMNKFLCLNLNLILCVKSAAGSVEVLDRKNQGINPMA